MSPIGKFKMSKFRIERFLKYNKMQLVVLCKSIQQDEVAIIACTRPPQIKPKIFNLVFPNIVLDVYADNDNHHMTKFTYGNLVFNCMFIYPADDKYIKLYECEFVDRQEPAEFYNTYTVNTIERMPSCKWIYNLLEQKAEQTRVVLVDKDPNLGFVLARNDYEFGRHTRDSTYCAFVMRRDLRSVRDLTANELPLLENILAQCRYRISQLTGLWRDEFTSYLHYQPTYWHLHIHFKLINYSISNTCLTINEVIYRLKRDSNYFKAASLLAKFKSPIWPRSMKRKWNQMLEAEAHQKHYQEKRRYSRFSKKNTSFDAETQTDQPFTPPPLNTRFIEFDYLDEPVRKKQKLVTPSLFTLSIPNPVAILRNAFLFVSKQISSFFKFA